MSLGTDIGDDGVSVIIPRNTAYPCERVKKYKTIEDNQPFMVIKVLQGEHIKEVFFQMAKDRILIPHVNNLA